MSKSEDRVRLGHMFDATRKAIEFIRNRNRPDLDNDEQLTLSLTKLLEVIGEAAKNVSPACRERYPHIAWKEIAGTRDRLIHAYFDVDLDIVWKIVTEDLPKLMVELQKIMLVK